jgi:hypothetical protein
MRLVGGYVRILSMPSRIPSRPLKLVMTSWVSFDSWASSVADRAEGGMFAEMSSCAGTAFMNSRSSFE